MLVLIEAFSVSVKFKIFTCKRCPMNDKTSEIVHSFHGLGLKKLWLWKRNKTGDTKKGDTKRRMIYNKGIIPIYELCQREGWEEFPKRMCHSILMIVENSKGFGVFKTFYTS